MILANKSPFFSVKERCLLALYGLRGVSLGKQQREKSPGSCYRFYSFKKFAFTAKRLQQMASATITWHGLFAKTILVWPVFDLIFFVVRHFMVTKLAVAFFLKSTR